MQPPFTKTQRIRSMRDNLQHAKADLNVLACMVDRGVEVSDAYLNAVEEAVGSVYLGSQGILGDPSGRNFNGSLPVLPRPSGPIHG
jgi:hypothetical protein